MNERIEKLAKKSGATVNEGFDGTKSFVYGITMSPEELEKFAELIVRECAQICRNQPNVYALKADRDNCAIAIEQHFGVEL